MKTTRHATYNLNYHIVWIPKYRQSVLVGDVATRVRDILHEIADEQGLEIIDLTVQPDHIHLFVSSPPKHAPSLLANCSKASVRGNTTTATPTTTARKSSGHAAITQAQRVTFQTRLSRSTSSVTRKPNSDRTH